MTQAVRSATCRGGSALSGRHRGNTVVPADRFQEQALIAVIAVNRRPAVSALEQSIAGVEPQPAALLLGAMTAKTNPREHRPDAILEEFLGEAIVGPSASRQDGQAGQPQGRKVRHESERLTL